MRKPYKQAFKFVPRRDRLQALRNLVSQYASFKKADESSGMPPISHRNKKYGYDFEQASLLEEIRSSGTLPTGDVIEDPLIRMLMMQQLSSGYIDMDIIDPKAPRMLFNTEIGIAERIPTDQMPRKEIKFSLPLGTSKEKLFLNDITNLYNADKQALVWVNFITTADRLMEYLKEVAPEIAKVTEVINGEVSQKNRKKILERYRSRKTRFLIAHPKTIGIGRNEFAGTTQYMLWYELTYDHALYEQAIGRLYRDGQKLRVLVNYYMARGKSVEERIRYLLTVKGNLKDIMFVGYFGKKIDKSK